MRRERRDNAKGKATLTAADFLGKGTIQAYLTPKQLLDFVDTSRDEDLDEFEAFFDLTKEQLRIVVPRRGRVDKGAMPYKYPNFIRANGTDGAKVPLIGNMNQFMVDYRDGKFSTDFTLEELIDEAEKAQS